VFVETEILTHCAFGILLEASKIDTQLYVNEVCTCKELVYLVILL